MTGTVKEIMTVNHEPGGKLGNSPEEKFVARAAKASKGSANPVITLGMSKGWRFSCRPGNIVALMQPGAGTQAVTYTFVNAALWRAIKNRGASLT